MASVITLGIFAATHFQWQRLREERLLLAFLLLTVVHILLALDLVGRNFPTA